MKGEDFKPNVLETLFTEPKEDGLLIKAQDLLGGAVLDKQDIGTLTVDIFTVDIFTVDISTLEPTQFNKFVINTQIL